MNKYKLSHRFISLYLASLLVNSTIEEEIRNATRTDLTQCKLTHFGTEYKGQKGTTEGGVRCQFWHTQEPLHKISSEIKDDDFPERSMRIAKNYCRNPTRDKKGPWCYTTEPTLIDDECGIPLCNYGECRISGTGAEYGGTKKISAAGKKCKLWNKRHKLAEGRAGKFSNKNFPELSRDKAKTFCRNPNDDTGGPWCYVEQENFEIMEKQYCDIPFCDDKDCLVYVRNASVYSTITRLNETFGNITLWVKLWNPADEKNAEAKLLLSLVPIPTSSKKIAQDWRAGVEIVISNAGSGQVYPTSEDENDFENTPDIILGSKWTGFWITWGGGFVSVGLHGSTKALFMEQYKKKNTISSLYPDGFLHYGIMGTGVLWSTEFCQEACEVHTTFGMEYLRVWPLQPSNTTYEIRFNVRASKDIAIRLYQSPGSLFPCFTITIGDADAITLIYQESEKTKLHLKDAPGKNLLDFWVWKDFTVSIFGPHLRLFSERVYGNEEILYAKDNLFGTIRWFSVGSRNNVAMWTFFCSPETDLVEEPTPPNCIANLADYDYEGSQWTSINEMPCIPWTSTEIPDDDKKDDLFVEASAMKAINKCRNPGNDPKGPYCYSISLENSLTASKQYCQIRSCRSSECRTAGTANDYMGTLSVTRSGRTCAEWLSSYDYERLESGKNGRGKKVEKIFTTPMMKSETSTSASKGSVTKSWKVQDFLDWHKANPSFGSGPTLGDEDEKDIHKTSIGSKKAGATSAHTTSSSFRKRRMKDYPARQLSSVPFNTKTVTKNWMKNFRSLRETFGYRSKRSSKPIHPVNPEYFNGTLYPEQNARNASNYCRDPSRNIAGTWCYTTDPEVPQDLCDVRDCHMPEECIFLVKGQGVGRRLYVLPEHRSEGLHFSLKAWEPDQPDSITFVFTADDGLNSRYILKVGALDNEKVMLYYQSEEGAIEMVKKKTLPHLLYLGKWSSFVVKIPRGHISVYYEGASNPLFEWNHPEPDRAFLPIYYYYTSELGHTIGVAFDCSSRCHIENTKTDRFTRILPLSTWSKDPIPNPSRIELMIRAEGIVLIPLLLFPGTPGYYAITLGELREWVYFLKNTYPKVNIYHKQKAPSILFTTDSWTNITLIWFNRTINVLWNGTQVFHYEHTHPLLFYYFSLGVDAGGWATWAVNCIPSGKIYTQHRFCETCGNSASSAFPRTSYILNIDGDPEDGGWSEWGPWACSASCNGGVGTRKRVCNNPEPNVKGEPCLGPSIMSGRCNTITCGDITDDTVSLIKRRIQRNYTSLSINEGQEITIPSDPDIIKAITAESPDSEIEWSHNGIFVYPDKDRLKIEEHNIVIKRARTNDSGVYTITLLRADGTHMIFKMVTLVVYPVRSFINIRETLPMTVSCHCVVLGYLYTDLTISWTIGKKRWKHYGTTLPISVNVDIVPALNRSHKGLWECVVEQEDLGFKWTTNAILVNILGPPNWRNHLMEDEFTRPIFGWMPNETFVAISALIIFLLLTACIVVGTSFYTRFRESGKYHDTTKTKDSVSTKKVEIAKLPINTRREVKAVGTQYAKEENYDDKIVETSKSRISKIRRSREHDEKPERKKLIADTETDESS